MNIIIRRKNKYWNLGLTRISGSGGLKSCSICQQKSGEIEKKENYEANGKSTKTFVKCTTLTISVESEGAFSAARLFMKKFDQE